MKFLEGHDEVVYNLAFLLDEEPVKGLFFVFFFFKEQIALNSILARLNWSFLAFYVKVLKNSKALCFSDGVNLGN